MKRKTLLLTICMMSVMLIFACQNAKRTDEANDSTASEEARKEALLAWVDNLEHNHPLDFRNNEKLHEIAFGEALEMSFAKIKEKYLKDYLPMMRALMRKDNLCIGYSVSDEVEDDFLDNLMALRWRENLKLWTMQWEHKENRH